MLNWLEFTNPDPTSFSKSYPNFRKIKDTLNYVYHDIALSGSFYYYSRKCHDDPKYDSSLDSSTNQLSHIITQEDIDLIKPE